MEIAQLLSYYNQDSSLRDYQRENKQKIYDAWSRCQSVMLQMPTGTGKTRLFVSIIKDIFQYGRDNKVSLKVLILVHRTELIDQIDEELGYRYNLAHGIIQSGEKERKIYPIQLASVQTLSRRLDKWTDKEFDFIIVDEAHHVKADSYQKIIKAFPYAKLLGVTATPVRMNGHGFTDTFQELIVSPSVREFIDEGYLSQYEYYSVARSSFIQKEIDGIRKFSQGDYAESELERVCDNDRIRAQVVKTYLDFANGKRGIVYTINKIHNQNLCDEFIANGVDAVAIDSDTPREMREQYIQQFRRGEYKIICNVNLFTEGFDCPDIEFIQLARPTKSLALYLQQVGRGLRISEAKEKTLFLDNVGLYNRFGFPSSKRMWRHHFEGRYDGNKTEEEVEGKKDVAEELTIKRERHQNLEEGHEKIHLIQTTEEKKYLEKRTEELKEWLNTYIKEYVRAINSAFNVFSIKGLGLKVARETFIKSLYACHVYIKEETVDIKTILKIRKFDFYSYKDNEYVFESRRVCRNYEELVDMLDNKLHNTRRDINANELKLIIKNYKALHFTKEEIYDIIQELRNQNAVSRIVPQYLDEDEIPIISYIINLAWDVLSTNIKDWKSIIDLAQASFEEIKNKRVG